MYCHCCSSSPTLFDIPKPLPFLVCFLPSSSCSSTSSDYCLFPVAISYRSLGSCSWYKRINMHFDLCLDGCSPFLSYLFNTFIYQKLFIFRNWVDREIYFLEPCAFLVFYRMSAKWKYYEEWATVYCRSSRNYWNSSNKVDQYPLFKA